MNVLMEWQNIAGAILAIGGAVALVTGWAGRFGEWVIAKFRRSDTTPTGSIEVPGRTLLLLADDPRECWWHLGSYGGAPAMQVVGQVGATNVSQYAAIVTSVRLRKPAARGRGQFPFNEEDDPYSLPIRSHSKLMFDLWVVPPVAEKGSTFVADLCVIDQFGNEHWLNGVAFHYR